MIYYYGPEYRINEVYNSTDKEFIQIVSCYDGDTCTSSEGEKIRLAHIDAPEKLCGIGGRPCPGGLRRSNLLHLLGMSHLSEKKTITIKRIGKDRYGRTVAKLFANELNVQEQMVEDGHVKVYEKYAFLCEWSK
ncbi:MAG TPA: nuclease [Candidatus Dadabacteria bacterium]|nr:nuclease [Candidatus Dadabacteria bacterium]